MQETSQPPKRPVERVPQVVHPEKFCDNIQKDIEAGHGFVPLVGAGLSAESGIPVGTELSRYLTLCIAKALGLLGLKGEGLHDSHDVEHGIGDRWHPVDGVWPAMEGNWVRDADEARDCLIDVAVHLRVVDEKGETQRTGHLADFQDVCRQGYGALSDWRLALQFLARIKPSESNPNKTPINRVEVDHSYSVRVRYEHFPEFEPDFRSILQRVWERKIEGAEFSELRSKRPIVEEMLTHTAKEVREQKKLATKLTERVKRQSAVSLGAVDKHVIDSLLNQVVGGKSPSMGHRMLIHLIQAIRARVILSLNFDDLLEQAAHESKLEIGVLNVHQEAGLPPARLLNNKPTVIKVHGGHYGLRADLTLDEAPTETDRLHFRSYFTGPQASEKRSSAPKAWRTAIPAKDHLLVVGVSGRDTRVRLLVQDALAAVPGLKVYWYCFSSRTEREIKAHFRDFPTRVIGVRHCHLGLLLWEIYQRITRSLPPSGLEFPATWHVPSPPRLITRETAKVEKDFRKEIETAKEWLTVWHKSQDEQFRTHATVLSPSGLLIEAAKMDGFMQRPLPRWRLNSLAWFLFEKWSERPSQRCVWLDSEDIENCLELKVRLLQTVGRLSGPHVKKPPLVELARQESSDPKDPSPKERHKVFLDELASVMAGSGQKWILFLNLRGAHRYSANPFARLLMKNEDVYPGPRTAPESWLNTCRERWEWPMPERAQIAGFINELATTPTIQRWLAVVVLCNAQHEFPLNKQAFRPVGPLFPKEYGWLSKRASRAFDWMKRGTTKEKTEKARLLRALTLLQQVQHRSAFVTRAILGSELAKSPLEKAWRRIDSHLDKLIKERVVRSKPGGFLWTHWHVREYLRCALITQTIGLHVHRKRADIHLGLADWYVTFFRATGDPLATFQAVYHRCRVAQLCFDSSRDRQLSEDERAEEAVRARGALCQAANHLEAARASVVARSHPLDTEKCLKGYLNVLTRMVQEEHGAIKELGGAARQRCKRNLRFLMMIKVRAQLYRIWFYRDVGWSDRVHEECGHLRRWFKIWGQPKVNLLEHYQGQWPDDARWSHYWLEWEQAVVCISLRCYDIAHRRLGVLARRLGLDIKRLEQCRNAKVVWELANRWNDKIGKSTQRKETSKTRDAETARNESIFGRFDARRIMVYVLRRLMELCLLRAEAEGATRRHGWDKRRRQYLECGERYYLAAQIMPRYVLEEENSRLRIEVSRLHSVMAGNLAQKGDHGGVQRHINEARGLLASLPESEESIAQAVVDLREIYCKFARLQGLRRLQAHRRVKLRSPKTKLYCKELKSEILKAEAWLDEISHHITEVEQRMTQNRKSLWWWQTLCRYQMVHLEYTELVRRWREEHATQGSFHGEAAAERNSQVADRVMRDACRRVNYDAYQLARIAEAYLNFSKLRTFQHGGLGEVANVLRQVYDRWCSLIRSQLRDRNAGQSSSLANYVLRVIRDLEKYSPPRLPDGYKSTINLDRQFGKLRRTKATFSIARIPKPKAFGLRHRPFRSERAPAHRQHP